MKSSTSNVSSKSRYIIAAIVLCLIFSGTLSSAAAITNSNHSVTTNNFNAEPAVWAKPAFDQMKSNGLAESSIMGQYNKPASRLEFARHIMLLYCKVKNLGIPIEGKTQFTDINDSLVKMAVDNKIIMGRTPTTFDPYANVQRQEVCVMITRFLTAVDTGFILNLNDTAPFRDNQLLAAYARPAVVYCYKNGIMSGVAELTMAPTENVTREQMITLLYRLAANKGYIAKLPDNYGELDYYMLNGFKVPKENKLFIGSDPANMQYIDIGWEYGKSYSLNCEKQVIEILKSKINNSVVEEVFLYLSKKTSADEGLKFKYFYTGDYIISASAGFNGYRISVYDKKVK